MAKVLSIILGGGKGTRLYPLTKERSKPAVPFGGKHRIVDIPISNCINSGFNKIYILTQFNSASLHMHISKAYNFDRFSNGFVEILAAEQTLEHSGWYEGTADAVRKNFMHFKTQNPTHYIILSGDQLYQMDLEAYLNEHIKSGAQITIATTAVTRQDASGFGLRGGPGRDGCLRNRRAFRPHPAGTADRRRRCPVLYQRRVYPGPSSVHRQPRRRLGHHDPLLFRPAPDRNLLPGGLNSIC